MLCWIEDPKKRPTFDEIFDYLDTGSGPEKLRKKFDESAQVEAAGSTEHSIPEKSDTPKPSSPEPPSPEPSSAQKRVKRRTKLRRGTVAMLKCAETLGNVNAKTLARKIEARTEGPTREDSRAVKSLVELFKDFSSGYLNGLEGDELERRIREDDKFEMELEKVLIARRVERETKMMGGVEGKSETRKAKVVPISK